LLIDVFLIFDFTCSVSLDVWTPFSHLLF